MRTRFIALLLFFFCSNCFAAEKIFEGTYSVQFKSEKGLTSELSVLVKDSVVLLKQVKGGNVKYSSYLLNLNTNQLTTLSKPEKKMAITYPLIKLMALYEKSNLKEGYKVYPDLSFTATEKVKEESGMKMTKYTGENPTHKSSLWLAETGFNFNQLIPLLRLLDFWNDAQLDKETIMEAEVTGKAGKRTSTVLVTFKKEFHDKKLFEVPKGYLQKDFVKLMEQEKNNKDLDMVIKTFSGF